MALGEDLDPNKITEITASIRHNSSGDTNGNDLNKELATALPSKDTDSFSFDNYVSDDTIKLQANVAGMQEEFTAFLQLLTIEREIYKHNEELYRLERDTLIRECSDLKDAMETSTSTINQMKLEFQGKIGDQARRIESLSSLTKQPQELDKAITTSLMSIDL